MVQQIAPVESSSQLDDLHRLLIEGNPMCWLDQYGVIHTKKVNDVDPEFRGTKYWKFRANPLQNQLAEIVAYMLDHKLPVRILVYKPRQKGSSTGSMGIADWFIKRFGHNAYLCGNSARNCGDLFEILRIYNKHDRYDWGFTVDVQDKLARYGNGARFQQSVAKDMEAGRGANLGVVVMTEIARWAEDEGKVRDAGKVFSSLMGCVPKEPNTLVIGETTVRGGSGVFYEQWQAAKTFEQLKAGDYEYGDFIKVFMPWYVFADSVLPITDVEAARIRVGLDCLNEVEKIREQELMRRYGCTPANIKYFRHRLKECDYDTEERDREEPTTEESGFFATQPCFFNKSNVVRMRQWAEEQQKEIKLGVLEWDDNQRRTSVAWSPATVEDRPLWMKFEDPEFGRRYSIGVDNSRGLASQKDSDCHAVVVIREGFVDKNSGLWMPPRVVACLRPQCRIDIDVLADEVAKLSRYYGRALIIPEANNDCGLIMCLRKLGAKIYERVKPATDKEDQQPTGKLGFWTSDDGAGRGVRSEILAELRSVIRKMLIDGAEGIEIPFLHVIDELEHFTINPDNGKAEALDGWHDDFVMALAFAFFLRTKGTLMERPAGMIALPPDVRAMLAQDDAGRRRVMNPAHRV